MIIDAHLHLDETIDGTAQGAAKELNTQLTNAGISRAIVLHLESQPWSAEEVAKAIAPYKSLRGFINVHPYNKDAKDKLKAGIDELNYIGLKLHPRLQEFKIDHEKTLELVRFAGELNIPVLFDAFPDGTHIMQGFSPVKYAELAKLSPETRIIWAHMGGHYVLDFMMLAKRLPNVYMDCSYSLMYYKNSSIVKDMVYAMRSMKFDRIFYGSDYPDRSIIETKNSSITIFKELGLNEDELTKIMSTNAINFFKWTDL
jgi:predicted TIM-barrel fold metal-dependent hydrolase